MILYLPVKMAVISTLPILGKICLTSIVLIFLCVTLYLKQISWIYQQNIHNPDATIFTHHSWPHSAEIHFEKTCFELRFWVVYNRTLRHAISSSIRPLPRRNSVSNACSAPFGLITYPAWPLACGIHVSFPLFQMLMSVIWPPTRVTPTPHAPTMSDSTHVAVTRDSLAMEQLAQVWWIFLYTQTYRNVHK